MPYNFSDDSFQTQKLCSRLSSKKVGFYTRIDHFAFLLHFGGLEGAYDVRLRLIGKSVVDFLLAIIELFSLVFTAHAVRANISPFLKGVGDFGPKF